MLRSCVLCLVLGLAACDSDKDPDTGEDTDVGEDTGDTADTADTGDSGDTGPVDEDHDTYSVEGGDCDDQDPEVHPGATEVWYDGIDQDCDGDDGDQDGDGHAKSGFGGTDCNDDDATIFPGATEVCDGVDQDCDGGIDEDAVAAWFRDGDADGYGDAGNPLAGCTGADGYVNNADDCDDENAAVNPAAVDECDGKDNNCDGSVDEGWPTDAWYRDVDGDGHGGPDEFIASCYQPAGYAESWRDCDDADATVHPDADEVCDGKDNDCDGTVDPDTSVDATTWYTDGDGDGFGDPATGWTSCSDPGTPDNGDDCDDGDAGINPDAAESCNGVDDDCDTRIDEAGAIGELTWYLDGDGDGFGDAATASTSCEGAADEVADATDCDDGDAAVSPAGTEACNGVDDDCDTDVDEAGATGETDWYADADGDGYGDGAATSACDAPAGHVAADGDCDDGDELAYPGAAELCDGVDQDCDGATADEVGAATWFDAAGTPTDVSVDLAAGTVASPVVIGDAASADLVMSEGTLQLCDGTWYARLAFSDPASVVEVVGYNGAGSTELTIAASSGGPNASIVSVTDATLTLDGLTLRDGSGTSGLAGGGIAVRRSSTFSGYPTTPNVTLVDSIVTENSTAYGGGVAIYGYGWVDLLDSRIEGNEASVIGGAVWMQTYGKFTCEATVLGEAGVADNTAPTAGGVYIGSMYGGQVSTVGCDWGQDSAGDDNADYDIQQNPAATDHYCYPNAASLTTTVACSGGSCTASTDSTCP